MKSVELKHLPIHANNLILIDFHVLVELDLHACDSTILQYKYDCSSSIILDKRETGRWQDRRRQEKKRTLYSCALNILHILFNFPANVRGKFIHSRSLRPSLPNPKDGKYSQPPESCQQKMLFARSLRCHTYINIYTYTRIYAKDGILSFAPEDRFQSYRHLSHVHDVYHSHTQWIWRAQHVHTHTLDALVHPSHWRKFDELR